MKKRWKIAIGLGGLLVAAVLAPIAYIEIGCRGNGAAFGAAHRSILARPEDQRAEVRTWLTYPEWHIVYSAESFGRFLGRNPPSAFPYGRHITSFWSSYCAINRRTAGAPGAGEAKVMIYTIGVSYTIELALKALYEKTIGWLFERASGFASVNDRYAAAVQQLYGAFMHETPWYAFGFGDALDGLWRTSEPDLIGRHWERRFALSTEYGLKAGYATLIGWASGATLGRDETTLRMVLLGRPDRIASVDPRLRMVRQAGKGRVIVEAPRYAQLTDILAKLARAPVAIAEIAGNDDIFVTALMPVGRRGLPQGERLLTMPLDDRPGWQRLGMTTKVSALPGLLRAIAASGGELEHVYDY